MRRVRYHLVGMDNSAVDSRKTRCSSPSVFVGQLEGITPCYSYGNKKDILTLHKQVQHSLAEDAERFACSLVLLVDNLEQHALIDVFGLFVEFDESVFYARIAVKDEALEVAMNLLDCLSAGHGL